MKRITIGLTSVALVLVAYAAAHGQIVTDQKEYHPGEAIVLTVDLENVPEGAVIKQGLQLDLTGTGDTSIKQGPKNNVFHVWAEPSKVPYKAECFGMWGVPHPKVEGAWIDFGLFRYRASFKVLSQTPGPDPDPDPDPPNPTPGGPYQLMFFYQAGQRDNMREDQRDILTSVKVRDDLEKQGHAVLEIMDSDAMAGPVKDEYKPFVDSAKGVSLPAVAIAPKDGGRVVVQPLPANFEELVKLLDNDDLGKVTTSFIGAKP